MTVTTNDLGNTGTGGALADTDTIAITVNAVNDGPTKPTRALSRSMKTRALVISGISISDVDAGTVSVTLSVASGTLNVSTNAGGGVTSGAISGNGSETVTITGSLSAINATLASASGLVYQGTLNFNGNDVLTVLTNDLGNTGTGGALTDNDTIAITVNAVNDAPTNTVPLYVQRPKTLPKRSQACRYRTSIPAGAGDLVDAKCQQRHTERFDQRRRRCDRRCHQR